MGRDAAAAAHGMPLEQFEGSNRRGARSDEVVAPVQVEGGAARTRRSQLSGVDAGARGSVTYATNRFDFSELVSPQGQRSLDWPRCVAVRVGP